MNDDAPPPPRGRLRWWVAAYLLLLAISHTVWAFRDTTPPRSPQDRTLELERVDGDARGGDPVTMVYREYGPPDGPVLVLIHGSPGTVQDFDALASHLRHHRILVPDLPGFGGSTRSLPDYSARAHADYLLQMLDRLEVDRAHFVPFSMGGAVALRLYDRAPDRVASVALVACIGVQELELFGRHDLNHMVHGAQLAMVQGVRWLTPHFGGMDDFALGVPYARNFYETDQRPLRGILERFDASLAVLHGEHDFLVPVEVAREHHRLVPQSELTVFDDGHFLLWMRTAELARGIDDFVTRVEAGSVPSRADAAPGRVAAAVAPFDPSSIPPFSGPALLVMMVLLVLATFVSEDLTCIGTGLLVAQGRLGMATGVAACFAGLFLGDLALYLIGRWMGRPVVERAPFRWFTKRESLVRAAAWFEERGGRVIILARVIPGMRVPTYVGAGVIHANVAVCALWFAIAAALWTPALVGIAALLGNQTLELLERWGTPAFIGLALLVLTAERIVPRLFTRRSRRQLAGSFRRWGQFEFWPWWLVYTPVYALAAWLAIKHRGLTVVTAANPAIPTGGFAGESKTLILAGLGASGAPVPKMELIPAGPAPSRRVELVETFRDDGQLEFPLVLKPDVGERGDGVEIIADRAACAAYLRRHPEPVIAQEFVAGPEFGVCWYKLPGEARGHVYSITEKRLPTVTGDGRTPLADLILADRRAACMATAYLAVNEGDLESVPADGEEVPIARLGNHRLGCLFLDGNHLLTPELEDAIERIGTGYEGFWIGRFDVRSPSVEAFRQGEFSIVELNGITSEPGHIYAPGGKAMPAYRALFFHWKTAFEIGARNVAAGATPARLRDVLREI